MVESNIIRKVRRLLALANDNAASDNEVEVALAKAQSLITKHKIDSSNLDIVLEEVSFSIIDIYYYYYDPLDYYINHYYFRHLLGVICKYNFCKYIYYDKYHKSEDGNRYKYALLKIIGKEEDIINVKMLFDYSHTQFLALALKNYKDAKKTKIPFKGSYILVANSYNYVDKLVFLRSYLKGTIEGLELKLKRNQPSIKEGESFSLIVANYDSVISSYIEENLGKLKTGSIDRSNSLNIQAYDKGKKDASVENKRLKQ